MANKGAEKGKRFEREVAKEICRQFGWEYKVDMARTPNSGGLQLKGDIVVYNINLQFPLHIECKFGYNFTATDIVKESSNLQKFMQQAVNDCPPGKIPVLVASSSRQPRYIIFRSKDIFVDLFIGLNLSFTIITDNYIATSLEHLEKITNYWHVFVETK